MNKKLSIVLLAALTMACGHATLPRREIFSLSRNNELVAAWDALPRHTSFFVGTTASMEPVMSWWDTILVEAVGTGDAVVVGDVYIYTPSWHNGDIVHQLVRVSGHKLLFKGTNNRRYDPWVDRDKVHYVVRRVLATREDTFAGGINP